MTGPVSEVNNEERPLYIIFKKKGPTCQKERPHLNIL